MRSGVSPTRCSAELVTLGAVGCGVAAIGVGQSTLVVDAKLAGDSAISVGAWRSSSLRVLLSRAKSWACIGVGRGRKSVVGTAQLV